LRDAALVEVADQYQMRAARLCHQAFALGQRLVDVGAAAELGAEKDFDGIGELVGQVDDRGVEDDEPGREGADRGHDGGD
jgi:hypothetical protein